MGVGVTAGGPYFCAKGNVTRAITVCMKYPLFINVTELVSITHAMEQNKTIDPVQEMQGDKVLLVSGLLDTVVRQGVMVKLLEWYKNFVDASNISTVFEIPAEHAMLTDDYGNFCAYFGPPYINDCFYSAAYWTLQHIYGDVVPATSFKANSDHLLEFNQSEFFGTAQKLVGMDDTGYLYVPSTCQNKSHACRLHIALHGCLMSRQFTGSTFVEHAGYNQVAEVNDIIVLYPQTHSNRLNPNGCFDWWGYTSPAYGKLPYTAWESTSIAEVHAFSI
jgi:hypothetical protein